MPEAPQVPEDFVDFYQVLDVDRESTTTHLRRRINELYSESMSNRDHRNPNKRRRYEALCELLPYCRIVLLDPDKRARYDRYLLDVEEGATEIPDFETLMEEIAGSVGPELPSGEKIGLLGVEGDDDYLPNASSAEATAAAAANARGRRAADRAAREAKEPARIEPLQVPRAEKGAIASNATTVAPTKEDSVTLTAKRRGRRPSADSLMGSVISVIAFAVVLAIAWVFTPGHNLRIAVIPAAIVGVIVWITTHRRATPIK